MQADDIADALNSYTEGRLDIKRLLLEEQALVRRVLDDTALVKAHAAQEVERLSGELQALREELKRSQQLNSDLQYDNETIRARLAALEARERRGYTPVAEPAAHAPPSSDRELEELISKYSRLGVGRL